MSSERVNFVPCVGWVRRGVAKAVPETLELNSEDVKRVIDETKQKLNITDDVDMDALVKNEDEDDSANEDVDEDFNRRYGLDTYDDEDEEEEHGGAGTDVARLTMYSSNAEDPYFDRTDETVDQDEDQENFEIKKTDNLLLVGHIETNASILEVHVYNKEDLYIHHDVVLPAFPLCFEWLNFDSAKQDTEVNYVATGDMTEDISIWDLDVVNQLEPVSRLSGHSDAVLALAWNSLTRNVMASGSADGYAILWDLDKMSEAQKKGFGSKCQALQFHPTEAHSLLMGYDNGILNVADTRSTAIKSWKVSGEIENAVWSNSLPSYFFAGTDTGTVYCFDTRSDTEPVYSIAAHDDEEVSGLAMSSSCPGLLVTTSCDKSLKIWDVGADEAAFVAEYPRLKVGRILGLAANPDEPFVFAVGGDAKTSNFRVVNLAVVPAVEALFGPRVGIKVKIERPQT